MTMTAGVTKAEDSVEGLSWNILGQTYVPKQVTESAMSWHATFPPGTFVPPHIHPDQDEFIYMLDGTFDLFLDGEEIKATNGDLVRLPRGQAHGIFNNSDSDVTCFFWVSPTQKLFELFKKIDGVPDPEEVVRLATEHNVHFLPPPGA
ncbi:cupin domain-containing protein [Alphaproteobacteria bacterium]|nr:cupin domain-containing protein [Alphaproteobacteria bacterium]